MTSDLRHYIIRRKLNRREKVLSEMGLRVVGVRNDEVMKNLALVVGQIKEWIAKEKSGSL